MQDKQHIILLFLSMFILIVFVGFFQSWNLALTIFNLCIISSIMSLGINIQWGNAGIVNFGVMGFAALGGLANIIVSMPPTAKAWDAGAIYILIGIIIFILSIIFSPGTTALTTRGHLMKLMLITAITTKITFAGKKKS